MKTPLMTAAFWLLATVCSGGEIYRWTDAQGRVHFSDRPVKNAEKYQPPAGSEYESVPLKALYPQRDYAAETREEKARRKAAWEKEQKARAAAQRREEKCRQARLDLRQHQSGKYTSTRLASLQKRLARREALKKRVRRYCD